MLAGRRGPTDLFAQGAGHSHKALVPVAGVPMLVRVVQSLRAAREIHKIAISIDDPAILHSLGELRDLVDCGILSFHTSQRSPSRSVLDYWQNLPAGESLLITTADHPLLTAEMINHFCSAATHSDADVILGIVSATLFRARYPQSKRTFIRLRGESFCGTNLFALRGPQAGTAVQFWTRAEQFRKQPWRLASVFGPLNLALFALRRFDLAAAVRRASQVIGARIAVVPMPFAECAIDVDSLGDLATASRILGEREGRTVQR